MGGVLVSSGAKGYAPRRPLETALHRGVSEGLPLFLAQAEEHGGVPGFVLRAVQRFLACGDLSRGFVLVKCDSCEVELKVAFSCRERSVCPSCSARRAALGAAHLVDHVLPHVAWRQWTLAFPRALRVALLKDELLLGEVLGAFVRAVFAFQRLRARQLGFVRPLPCAVGFIQNFTSQLLAYPHFHVLFPDGLFEGKDVSFAPLPPPKDEELEVLLRRVARRTMKLVNAHFPDGLPYAEDERDFQLAASAQTRLPLADDAPSHRRRGCAFLQGFSLHADTHLHQNDREALERLCRYGARGPLCLERLTRREDGKLEYRLKKPTPHGATVLVLTPLQLLKRLCPLVVKPRLHLTRFFGALAPNSKWRKLVVPRPPVPPEPAPSGAQLELPAPEAVPRNPTARPRLDWAQLLRRTWGFDVFDCPCGGRRRVLALVTHPDLARKILGLPSHPRTRPLPTGPPQLALPLH